MREKEPIPQSLEEVLETLDLLKLVAMKGQKEIREFSRYMMIWGTYAFLATFTGAILGLNIWLPLLYPAFFLTTAPVAGWGISLLTWVLAGLMVWGLWTLTHLGWLLILAIVLTATLSYFYLYGRAVKKGRVKPIPFKVMVGPKIGWSWGILMGGMGLVFVTLIQHLPASTPWDFLSMTLWGYAVGVGLFISGIMAPGFFWIGILGIFGIPLATSVNTTLGVWVYLAVAAAMVGYSFYLYRSSINA